MNSTTQAIAPASPLELLDRSVVGANQVLNPKAAQLLGFLHRQFNARRLELLVARAQRQQRFDAGELPDFLPQTAPIRTSDWRIADVPADLRDRRVEIIGPADRKTIINALNAPVQTYVADLEDSSSPTWENVIQAQLNLRDAMARTISHVDEAMGKVSVLNARTAALLVRPRGWHLPEKHVLVDDESVSASLFDFAVFLANNHAALQRAGTGAYFYLPKIESHLEARLWNEVFIAAEQQLGIPRGTIKVTVLIETLPAAFEMHEILYELRDYATGLSCGRWDYIFSFIKKLKNHPDFVLPDRSCITMQQPFLKFYVDLLIQTCHRRGVHAIGGSGAEIPIRDNPQANQLAMAAALADKQREAQAGLDGTWIAHPELAAVALKAFGASPPANPINMKRTQISVTAADVLRVPEGQITEAGVRHNIRVGVQYLEAWLEGSGHVPLYNVLEDAATAEICRAQLWQWQRHGVCTEDGQALTIPRLDALIAEELDALRRSVGQLRYSKSSYATAARIFCHMVTHEEFDDFFTVSAYDFLR